LILCRRAPTRVSAAEHRTHGCMCASRACDDCAVVLFAITCDGACVQTSDQSNESKQLLR
jgi:hypothetical protein